ncbi:MAG: hypothetical protein Q8P86_02035 [bacterium]|nr:hypothetical protein [bacterium]
MFSKFWNWYEKHYLLNVSVAAGLFTLQIIHLIWLFGEVIVLKLSGVTLFHFHDSWRWLVILVDYTEIPALFGISLIYINDLRKRFTWKPLLYLVFLNSQWLHIFWITDTFVVNSFTGAGTVFPGFLAWIAILIDYLEVPVMVETFKKLFVAIKERDRTLMKVAFEE